MDAGCYVKILGEYGSEMKVLLINPCFSNRTTDVPLGLAYIAAVAMEAGCNVKVIDADAIKTDITNNDILNIAKGYAPDLIGTSIYTDFARKAYELMGMLSTLQIPIVVGGPHPTAVPQEPLNFGATFVIRGEGENTFRELIQYYRGQRSLDSILGLSYIREGEVTHNKPRPPIEDLDNIPLPAKDLFNRDHYVGRLRAEPFGGISTSRGCPARCIYCYKQIHGRRFRFRQPLEVVEEIRSLKDKYGIKKFVFTDDAFSVNKERVMAICQQIIEQKLDIEWSGATRVDCVDQDLLPLMRESGCILLDYGIEHGDDKSLKMLKKGITLDKIKRALILTKEAGIPYLTNYIFGFPWDTIESVKQTLQHALKWHNQGFQSGPIVPYPGTELYEKYKDEYGLDAWWLKRDGIKWQDIKLIAKGHKLAEYSFFRLDTKIEEAIEKAIRRMRVGPFKVRNMPWWIYWLLCFIYKISPNLGKRVNIVITKGAMLIRRFVRWRTKVPR